MTEYSFPPSLSNKILKALHFAHQGISLMCSQVDASFLWPGMTSAISEMRIRCAACNRNAPSQPNAPPTPMIKDNTGPNACLDTDSFQRAILQYCNTPDRDTRLSPAMCIFGQPIRDFIPIHPGKYLPHQTWQETLSNQEEALRNSHTCGLQKDCQHIRGSYLHCQCVTVSEFKTRWDHTPQSATRLYPGQRSPHCRHPQCYKL